MVGCKRCHFARLENCQRLNSSALGFFVHCQWWSLSQGKDKPRTEAQQKAGEKGRWWKATVTGVEKARNTLLLAVLYEAQYEVEPTADQLDVRTEHVVWLHDERGAAQ